MKPQKIHYCWFGGNRKPEIVLKCIASWRKIYPEVEIVEWNETNFDVKQCRYCEEAYEQKKWAFVSDYCRFWVLYRFGGVYMDTDVELIKSLDEIEESFIGFETDNVCASGLIRGAKANDEVCRLLIESYEKDKFILEDGEENLITVCDRETKILYDAGLKLDGTKQEVLGTTIYPKDYFNPYDMDTGKITITDNTISIHHYAGSWVDKYSKFRGQIYRTLHRVMGKRIAEKIRKIVGRN